MPNCRNYLVIILERDDLISAISLKGETFLDALIDNMLLNGEILGYEVTDMFINIETEKMETKDLTANDIVKLFALYCCHDLTYYLIDITNPEKPKYMNFYDSIQ